AYLCTPLAVFSVVTHSVAFAVDHGFPRLFVAGIFGLTGLLSVAGRILFGMAADRIGRAASATISYGCTAAGTLCLLGLEIWPHAAALYAYALLFGLAFGARGPIITPMASPLVLVHDLRPHWSSYTTSFSGPRPTGPKRPIG